MRFVDTSAACARAWLMAAPDVHTSQRDAKANPRLSPAEPAGRHVHDVGDQAKRCRSYRGQINGGAHQSEGLGL